MPSSVGSAILFSRNNQVSSPAINQLSLPSVLCFLNSGPISCIRRTGTYFFGQAAFPNILTIASGKSTTRRPGLPNGVNRPPRVSRSRGLQYSDSPKSKNNSSPHRLAGPWNPMTNPSSSSCRYIQISTDELSKYRKYHTTVVPTSRHSDLDPILVGVQLRM